MTAQFKKHHNLHIWELNSPKSGPTLIIIGQIHGNEPAGFEVIQRLLKIKKQLAKTMRGGRLILIHGNVKASKSNKRYTNKGMDLNRTWLLPKEQKKYPPRRDSYEWKRHNEIKPFLQADKNTFLLDMHSSSNPTKPFLVLPSINRTYTRLINKLGVSALFGWNNLLPGERSTLEWVNMHGGVGMGVECGQHTDPKTVENAWQIAKQFLSISFSCFKQKPVSPVKIFKMIKPITYTEKFKWKKKKIVGPLHLKKGEVYGVSAQGKLISPDDVYMFLPNAHPEPQNPDIGYIAKMM